MPRHSFSYLYRAILTFCSISPIAFLCRRMGLPFLCIELGKDVFHSAGSILNVTVSEDFGYNCGVRIGGSIPTPSQGQTLRSPPAKPGSYRFELGEIHVVFTSGIAVRRRRQACPTDESADFVA